MVLKSTIVALAILGANGVQAGDLDQAEVYPCMKKAAEGALAKGLRKDPNYVYAAGAQDALEAAARKACPAPTSVSIMDSMGAAGAILSDWMHANPEKEAAHERADREWREKQQRDIAQDQAHLEAERRALSTEYMTCLFERADILARTSSEPAETVAQATFAACQNQREKVIDAYRRHGKPYDGGEVMRYFDENAQKDVILRIIEARAREPAPAPTAPPKPSDTSL